jgi:hypothetical protein
MARQARPYKNCTSLREKNTFELNASRVAHYLKDKSTHNVFLPEGHVGLPLDRSSKAKTLSALSAWVCGLLKKLRWCLLDPSGF